MRHWIVLSLLALSALGTGCADDGSTLFIVHNLAPDDECVIGVGNPSRGAGLLDVARIPTERGYMMFPLVGAQLIERANGTDVNPFDVHLTAMDVELRDEAGALLPLGLTNPFRVPTSTFIEAFGGTGTVPMNHATVEAIPPAYVNAIATANIQRVIVALRPVGVTNGGIDVEGAFHYTYPVQTCVGCTASCIPVGGEAILSCLTGQDNVDALTPCP